MEGFQSQQSPAHIKCSFSVLNFLCQYIAQLIYAIFFIFLIYAIFLKLSWFVFMILVAPNTHLFYFFIFTSFLGASL